MKLAWLTDPHLNFVEEAEILDLASSIEKAQPDVIAISGDIGEAQSVEALLEMFAAEVSRPVYFVLGNHDYYKGGIDEVRQSMRELSARVANLDWLPESGVVELSSTTALIGHGGWGDGRLGDFANSRVLLNDYILIRDLAGLSQSKLLERLNALGDDAATCARALLEQAVERFSHTIFLTHVPPFREACWHENKISGDQWICHFACKAVGEVLHDVMGATAR